MDDGTSVRCTSDHIEDIGHGVTIERRYLDGVLEGIAYYHECNGVQRAGWLPVVAVYSWKVEVEHPRRPRSSRVVGSVAESVRATALVRFSAKPRPLLMGLM